MTMKKIISTTLLSLFALFVLYHNLTIVNAEDKPYLPPSEQWADAVYTHGPFLEFGDFGDAYFFADSWRGAHSSLITPWGSKLECENVWNVFIEEVPTTPIYNDGVVDVLWESASTIHSNSGDGYAVGAFQDFVMLINGQPHNVDRVKHGGRVVLRGGKRMLEATWSYRMTGTSRWYPLVIVPLCELGDQTRLAGSAIQRGYNPMQIRWVRTSDLGGGHYSPLVDTQTPILPSNPNHNHTGYITSTNTFDVLLNRDVNTIIEDRLIQGALTGAKLVRNTSGEPLSVGEYKATVNTSGASHLLTGNILTGIGTGTLVWTITDYEDDVTIYTQPIISTTLGNPDITIYFPATGEEYANQWMSNNPSADAERRTGLDFQAHSSINGKYELVTLVDYDENGTQTKEGTKTVTKNATDSDVTNNMVTGWKNLNGDGTSKDTSINGAPVSSIAYKEGDHDTPLSSESLSKPIFFDSTKPTIDSVITTDEWATISTDAADALSGLEGVYFKFVLKDTTTGIDTPIDGSDWTPLSEYATTFAALADGKYDLYVYAKDNATNRSDAILANKDTPIIVGSGPEVATIRLQKEVTNAAGPNDIFLISMHDGSTLLTSAALKDDGNKSGAFELDMGGEESKSINISEIIPMDYDPDFTVTVVDNGTKSKATASGKTVTIHAGDDITIVVKNTLKPSGYFTGKDFVKNLFKSQIK